MPRRRRSIRRNRSTLAAPSVIRQFVSMLDSMLRRLLMLAALAGTTLVAAACGDRPDGALADSAALAARAPIPDSITGPGAREGTWQGTDSHSTWRAILDGPWITQIDEVAFYTDSARAMRQFRFDSSGFLAAAREERVQTLFGDKATPDTLHTLIEIEWQRDSLARSAKQVNGVDRLLQPYEVDNLRAHADELRRAARTGSAPSTPAAKP